jgi:hypothetical protein
VRTPTPRRPGSAPAPGQRRRKLSTAPLGNETLLAMTHGVAQAVPPARRGSHGLHSPQLSDIPAPTATPGGEGHPTHQPQVLVRPELRLSWSSSDESSTTSLTQGRPPVDFYRDITNETSPLVHTLLMGHRGVDRMTDARSKILSPRGASRRSRSVRSRR